MPHSRATYVIIGIIVSIIVIVLLGYSEILWLIGYYIVNGILLIGIFLVDLITHPNVYPIFYWITYFSAIIGVTTVIGTLMWYFKARKKFSSPVKNSKISAVNFILIVIIAVIISQLVLSIFQRELLYQISYILFLVSVIFLGIRTTVNISTSLAYRTKAKELKSRPLVSIVLPAYNEEKVIKKTLDALASLAYIPKEIICVNDGSTDNTLRIAQESATDKTIKVLSKSNGGKWSALNRGIKAAKGTIIICIDADTILDQNAIEPLIPHFDDPKVAAVAGNIKVGNRKKLLTKLQALEYISGLNIQRRSEAYFSKITVVPGPLGAFRASVLESVGLFSGDTFAEDADLTLKILKAGYKITYEKRAIGYTEAPGTLLDLGKQRYRWYRGILQSMTKHKDLLFNHRYGVTGFFMFPWMIFNGLIFSGFTFFTLLWLFVLMFNPVSGFMVYRPNPRGPPIEPPRGPPIEPPGRGPDGSMFFGFSEESIYQMLAQPQPELVIQIDFFQAIPLIYIFWFVFFLILEICVTVYAVSVDVKEKPKLAVYVILYKLFYGYLIDTIRILSQVEQYLGYPMKWEMATRSGELSQ